MCFNIENRRYTGSKSKLSNWIMQLINKECSGRSFVDLFAGTGVIAKAANNNFDHVIINDLLYSNYTIYKAFFEKGDWDKNKINFIVKEFNNIKSKDIPDNYFSINFGDKYFDKDVAKIIGFIREKIERDKFNLKEKEYNILLASLLYSSDKIANTVGHYDAYLQKKPKKKEFNMGQIIPSEIKNVDIYREDSNILATKINADIVYIDPPYNSRQYSRFYHVLETLTKWEKPELNGVAMKPKPENMSEYCKVKAPIVFEDLITNLSCKFIVVSYNNTYNSKSNSSRNKIELSEIKTILEKKGKTKIFKQKHRFFNTGKTDFSNHQEIVFITKVGV